MSVIHFKALMLLFQLFLVEWFSCFLFFHVSPPTLKLKDYKFKEGKEKSHLSFKGLKALKKKKPPDTTGSKSKCMTTVTEASFSHCFPSKKIASTPTDTQQYFTFFFPYDISLKRLIGLKLSIDLDIQCD